MDAVDTDLVAVGMCLGASVAGLMSTVVAAPIATVLGDTGAACGLVAIAGKVISRRLSVKVKKHDQVQILAQSKLNTVTDIISPALEDGFISDNEFKVVSAEIEKYTRMKSDIKAKTLVRAADRLTI